MFQVIKLDGEPVWRKRHYAVRRGKRPGTFVFRCAKWNACDSRWAHLRIGGAGYGQRPDLLMLSLCCCFPASVLDNGVTSLEYWRIVDVADDMSWAVFYYSGAAEAAGQSYSGSLLATADGKWPPLSELPRIQQAHDSMGIAIWELSVGWDVVSAVVTSPHSHKHVHPSG